MQDEVMGIENSSLKRKTILTLVIEVISSSQGISIVSIAYPLKIFNYFVRTVGVVTDLFNLFYYCFTDKVSIFDQD